MILVVSQPHDVHALEVVRCLERRGAEVLIFDTGRIPRDTRLSLEYTAAAAWSGVALVEGQVVDLTRVRSVWWRRPQPFNLHPEVGGAQDQTFALAETHAAVAGLWALLDADWINDPDRDEKAGRKTWQLEVARVAGLTIPRTCVTSDPESARAFVDSSTGPVVYKAFSATEQLWRETRVLRLAERQLIDTVKFAPVIFQDYVPARVDLRITIVGDRIFAAEIHSQSTSYAHDFRMDLDHAEIAAHELPADVGAGLLRMMRRLGLVYGAVDMRQTPDGDYVFLEINPAGQWLFVEQRTGQPISDALADALIAAGMRNRRRGTHNCDETDVVHGHQNSR
jgi:glutathione synthase/RimK-type ligase-like ATP-grasp enzyme